MRRPRRLMPVALILGTLAFLGCQGESEPGHPPPYDTFIPFLEEDLQDYATEHDLTASEGYHIVGPFGEAEDTISTFTVEIPFRNAAGERVVHILVYAPQDVSYARIESRIEGTS